MGVGLSKSRFVAGVRCPRMLWWTVHEPDAPELVVDANLQAIFDRGHAVGELARTHVPGGVLIDLPHGQFKERVAATAQALANGARVVYEASFLEDNVFVSVDILERRGAGFVLTEVKSTSSVKPKHFSDVAVQTHVVRRAGLAVPRAEVMHLNRECRHPDLSNLFVRKSVTREIRPLLRAVPAHIKRLHAMLDKDLPDAATGDHCSDPYECAFTERCWPTLPEHHVSTLYRIQSKKVASLAADGVTTITELPDDYPSKGPVERQIRSIKEGRMVVDPGLQRGLAKVKPPIAFLDFESVNPPVPAWPGCRPYQAVPVQFSCHTGSGAAIEHIAWLAERGEDPRRALAEALLAACKGAKSVLSWGSSFEVTCIKGLAEALPDLAKPLQKLIDRIHDLLPLVRDHVYHPDFGGSFSLKDVLPALVPGLGYGDLGIQEGMTASNALEKMLLGSDTMTAADRKTLRSDLLRYCERDTLAMVRLYERLQAL